MHNTSARRCFVDQAHGVVPCLPGVDDDRLWRIDGELQLTREDAALHFARREIVMVIQADLTDGEDLGVSSQDLEMIEGRGRGFRRVVRMYAYSRVDELVHIGETDGRFEIGRAIARADGQHACYTGGAGTLDNGIQVGLKLCIIQVAVRVDQVHFSLAPTGTSSKNPASTGLPPSREAATIMPFDSRPRNLRGCRLATITTLRPI